MKKILLATLALCLGGNIVAGVVGALNATTMPLEFKIKRVAETAIGCRPQTFKLRPGDKKKKNSPCFAKKYILYRKPGEKKWKKAKFKSGSLYDFGYIFAERKNGDIVVKTGDYLYIIEDFRQLVHDTVKKARVGSQTLVQPQDLFNIPPALQTLDYENLRKK